MTMRDFARQGVGIGKYVTALHRFSEAARMLGHVVERCDARGKPAKAAKNWAGTAQVTPK